jgi:crossover junction endodeoxyribonuclease RuvC
MNSSVLGFDPGIKVSGYGMVKKGAGEKLIAVDYGIIKNSSPDSFPLYLEKVYDRVVQIMRKFKPDSLAIEEPFIAKNPNVGLKIGQIVGVVSLAGIKEGIEVFGYSTLEIKQAVTGYGHAEKVQMQDMVKRLLLLEKDIGRYDMSDALGAAICRINSTDWENKISKS